MFFQAKPYSRQAASMAASTSALVWVTGLRMSSVRVTVSPSVRRRPAFTVSLPLSSSQSGQPSLPP